MRKSLPAAAVALTLLAGCSHSSDAKNVASTTPSTAASSPSLPPMFVPSSEASGAVSPPGATTAAGAGGTTSGTGGTSGANPRGRLTPRIQSLGTTWIDATVTRTGPGSCVGLTSTDGTAYAVYLSQSVRLTPGTKLRAKINPGKTPINCGKGNPARSDRVQIAG